MVVSLSIPAASSSRAITTRMGSRGMAYPPGPYICGSCVVSRPVSVSSGFRPPLRTIMQMRMRPWQKKMVMKRMMRISRMVNSLVLMFLVMERARSVWFGLIPTYSLTSRYREGEARHVQIVSNIANKVPDTKHRKI